MMMTGDEEHKQTTYTRRHDYCLKKNQNASRPSEHSPVRGKKCQNVYLLCCSRKTQIIFGKKMMDDSSNTSLHLIRPNRRATRRERLILI